MFRDLSCCAMCSVGYSCVVRARDGIVCIVLFCVDQRVCVLMRSVHYCFCVVSWCLMVLVVSVILRVFIDLSRVCICGFYDYVVVWCDCVLIAVCEVSRRCRVSSSVCIFGLCCVCARLPLDVASARCFCDCVVVLCVYRLVRLVHVRCVGYVFDWCPRTVLVLRVVHRAYLRTCACV